MIPLVCPNCGASFPVMAADSDGFCTCGMDYVLTVEERGDGTGLVNVRWAPDPEYPASGSEAVDQTYEVHFPPWRFP